MISARAMSSVSLTATLVVRHSKDTFSPFSERSRWKPSESGIKEQVRLQVAKNKTVYSIFKKEGLSPAQNSQGNGFLPRPDFFSIPDPNLSILSISKLSEI